jgi:LPS-assembly protein
MRRVGHRIAKIAIATALALAAVPACAQTLNDSLQTKARSAVRGTDRLLVEAKEIVYDNDRNTVSATGDVE